MRRTSFLFLIAFISACGGASSTATPANGATNANSETNTQAVEEAAANEEPNAGNDEAAAPTPVVAQSTPTPSIPLTMAQAREQTINGLNRFGLNALREMRDPQSLNASISPASIAFALGMTYEGSSGATRDEMRNVLGFAADSVGPQNTISSVLNRLDDNRHTVARNQPTRLYIANQLFVANEFEILPAFTELMQRVYGAPAERVDFLHAPEPGRVRINGWIADHTSNRIRDLIPSGAITAGTTLVLANAIYFNGEWATRFNAQATRNEDFDVAGSGANVNVRMMHVTSRFSYASHANAQWVSLPYAGDRRLEMVVALPEARDGDALRSWLDALDENRVREAVGGMRRAEVVLSLPKWTTTSDSMALTPMLQHLGMRRAFTDQAEFPRISNTSSQISQVFHKVFVDVSERGTEAAAATAVVMTRSTAAEPEERVEFRADHPFVYFLRDAESGLILFVGILATPHAA